MAKVYLIITIQRGNRQAGEPGMKYPDVYDAQEIEQFKQGPIVYEGALSRGLGNEECMIFVEQSVADAYVAAAPAQFRIVPKAGANAWLNTNVQLQERPNERVLDPDRMLAILAKQAVGQAFSQEDLDAVDPTNSTRGINLTPKDADSIFV